MKDARKESTLKLVTGALLTAAVVVLQFLGAFIRFGPFSVTLVLIPIVIGAAVCGWKISAWLGLMFGVIVLISGDATAFLTVNAPGTVVTVLLKGLLCGLAAGIVYKLFLPKNQYLAVVLAAIVCPIVNTGVFFLGCLLFFMETVAEWAVAFGFGENVAAYMFLGLAGGNFLFEMGVNIALSPIVIRILQIVRKNKA